VDISQVFFLDSAVLVPSAVGAAGVVGGVTAWVKTTIDIRKAKLDMEKARLEIEKLRAEAERASRDQGSERSVITIHMPTDEQVRVITHQDLPTTGARSAVRSLPLLSIACLVLASALIGGEGYLGVFLVEPGESAIPCWMPGWIHSLAVTADLTDCDILRLMVRSWRAMALVPGLLAFLFVYQLVRRVQRT
jgi:hypothetical protein